MAIRFNESAIPGRYTVDYVIRDAHRGNPQRRVEVLATPQEVQDYAREGYLVRENLLPAAELERLRAALAEAVAADEHLEIGGGRAFGGVFIRHLMDKHPVFLEMLDFAPTLSVARALFGPSVQMRGFTGRILTADRPASETEWHFHQRVVPAPIPPLFSRPQTMDVLLYLDDIDDSSGPLCVAPGSHNWLDRDLPAETYGDLPGQRVLKLPAGSAVLTSGSLWHRALPAASAGKVRRLLLFGYGPAWQKSSVYGVKPENGLTDQLLADADEETRELLGVGGFM